MVMTAKHWPPAKKRQKSTWNIGRNRLACGYGIGPKRWCRAALNAKSVPFRGVTLPEVWQRRLGVAKTGTAKAGSDGKRDRKISDREVSSAARVFMNVAPGERFATPRRNRGEGCVVKTYAWIARALNKKTARIHA